MNARTLPADPILADSGSWRVCATAAVEAVALGAPMITIAHLLLGLRAGSGHSAYALAAAGAGMAELRHAAAERPGAEPVAVRAGGYRRATTYPIDPAARAAVRDAPCLRGDHELLRLLLSEHPGPVTTVLNRVGVSDRRLATTLDDVVRWAAGSNGRRLLERPAAPDRARLVEGIARHLAAPSDRVWTLLTTPSRRQEWDLDPVVGGSDPAGSTDDAAHRPDGTRSVAWRWTEPAGVVNDLRVAVHPAGPAATLVELTCGTGAGRGAVAHVMRPLARRALRTQLDLLALGVGQAAA